MSTRGLVGWVLDGNFHATYNHSDSYPEYLGQRMYELVRTIQNTPLMEDSLRAGLSRLKAVEEDDKPSGPAKTYYKNIGLYNGGFSDRNEDDWYCLLREAQGAELFSLVADSKLKHFIESKDFLKDSLFCEWGWVLNFDTRSLEVYKGFWKKPGKYSTILTEKEKNTARDNGYYPCERIREIPFDAVAEDKWMRSACFKNGDKPQFLPHKWNPPTEEFHIDGEDEDAAAEVERILTSVTAKNKKRPSVSVHRDTMIVALTEYIGNREKMEREEWHYTTDSCHLATMREMLDVLKKGGSVSFKV